VVNKALIELSKRTGIPLAATNDIHYADPDDFVAQDILLCIGTNKKRDEMGRMRFENDQFYLKSAEEWPRSSPAARKRSQLGAHRRALRRQDSLPGPLLPEFVIPEGFADTAEYLTHRPTRA
jgi:DNA polymerase-3 subunit alpha